MKIIVVLLLTFILIGCGDNSFKQRDENKQEIEVISQKELLEAINMARSVARVCSEEGGLLESASPLKWNKNLYISAYEHSRDMAFSDTFSHDGSGTSYDITGSLEGKRSLFSERIHRHIEDKEAVTGENIAVAIYSLDEVVTAWLRSPKHCENIMNEEFTDLGISRVINKESRFGVYWTQDFSRRD